MRAHANTGITTENCLHLQYTQRLQTLRYTHV